MLAILGLAEAEGVLADAITKANKAFDENMAATEEAIKRFETLESQLQVTKNLFNELQIQIGDNLLPVATSFNNTIQKMILGLTASNKERNYYEKILESLEEQEFRVDETVARMAVEGPQVTVTEKRTPSVEEGTEKPMQKVSKKEP